MSDLSSVRHPDSNSGGMLVSCVLWLLVNGVLYLLWLALAPAWEPTAAVKAFLDAQIEAHRLHASLGLGLLAGIVGMLGMMCPAAQAKAYVFANAMTFAVWALCSLAPLLSK